MQKIICKGVLFDMDGTLIDTTEASEVTWKAWGLENKVPIEKIRAVHHGRRPEETISLVAPHLDALAHAKDISDHQKSVSMGIYPIVGANDFVRSLPLDSFGIVTAAAQAVLDYRFQLIGLPIPKICVTGPLLKTGKPDPEGYLLGAKQLGLNPKDCIVFEDAPAGLLAAKRAGMRSVAITTNYTEEQLREELGQDFEYVAIISNYLGMTVSIGHDHEISTLTITCP